VLICKRYIVGSDKWTAAYLLLANISCKEDGLIRQFENNG